MLKKIGLITITNIIIAALGYLILPVYLRLMTQEEFGEFSFIISVMSSFSLILSLSLYVPFIRNYSADEQENWLLFKCFLKTRKLAVKCFLTNYILI